MKQEWCAKMFDVIFVHTIIIVKIRGAMESCRMQLMKSYNCGYYKLQSY
jgi:hypothetical protein